MPTSTLDLTTSTTDVVSTSSDIVVSDPVVSDVVSPLGSSIMTSFSTSTPITTADFYQISLLLVIAIILTLDFIRRMFAKQTRF